MSETISAFEDYKEFSPQRLVDELRALSERDTRTIHWSGILRAVVHQAANMIERQNNV